MSEKSAPDRRHHNTVGVLTAALIAIIGTAPFGLLSLHIAPEKLRTWIAPFWLAFLAFAGFAISTRHRVMARILMIVLLIVALLNLGGCAKTWLEISRIEG